MSKQAIFDFDGTITTKDTTVLLLFALLKLRPFRFFGLMWFLFRMIASSDSKAKQGYKNQAVGHLIKGSDDLHLSGALQEFRKKVKCLYRQSILAAIDKANEDGCTVLIVTASPSFAINECVSDFPVSVLGTEFVKEKNIYTGRLKSENCHGREKVNRINEWAASHNIALSVQIAWSDHFSDFDMLNLSANRYWIGGENLRKVIIAHDPGANFVQKD